MQPDATVISNAAQTNGALNSESDWVGANGPRNYVSETGVESDHNVIMNNDVQLPTPPRSENSPSLSLSPREAVVQPFTYDGLFAAASQPNYAEWSSQQIGMFDSAVSLQTADELHLGAPQQHYIDYATHAQMTDYGVYAQPDGVAFQHQFGAPFAPQNQHHTQPTYNPLHQTFISAKHQPQQFNSATVALFSQHVSVDGGRCTYTIRLKPIEVGRFIGSGGSRIRQLQMKTRTTITVRFANDVAPAPADGVSGKPVTPGDPQTASGENGVPTVESKNANCADTQPSNGRSTREQQEASIPVVIAGICECVMDALREIYFHFPLSDFGPIDIPTIVKRELQDRANARVNQLHQRGAIHNGQNAMPNHGGGQMQDAAMANGTDPSATGAPEKIAATGSSKSRRRRAKRLAAHKAEREASNADRSANAATATCQPSANQGDSDTPVKSSEASASGAQEDRKPPSFSEKVMQKSGTDADTNPKPASGANSGSQSRGRQQPAAGRSVNKKKAKAIDIESMKDFPPLANSGTISVANMEAGALAESAQDTVDGAVEHATRVLDSLSIKSTCEKTDLTMKEKNLDTTGVSNNTVHCVPGARGFSDSGFMPPFPLPNNGYMAPLCPDSAQFAPPNSQFPYSSPFGYYPFDYATYNACQGYYPVGDMGPHDYYAANSMAQPFAYMPPKGNYGDLTQYAADGQPLNGYGMPLPAVAPGWSPDAAAFASQSGLASQLGNMPFSGCNQYPVAPPFGIGPGSGYDARMYDTPYCFPPDTPWTSYGNRFVGDAKFQHSLGSTSGMSFNSQSGRSCSTSMAAQPTGLLQPCLVSAVSIPTDGESDVLEAHVQLLVHTSNGSYTTRDSGFIESIQRFYSDENNLAANRYADIQDAGIGEILAVSLSDSKWYRAELLSRNEEQARVRLVDFGNTLEVPIDAQNYAKLTEPFSVANVAPFASSYRIRTIRSINGKVFSVNDAFALLSDAQRTATLPTYVLQSSRGESGDTTVMTDVELYIDDRSLDGVIQPTI